MSPPAAAGPMPTACSTPPARTTPGGATAAPPAPTMSVGASTTSSSPRACVTACAAARSIATSASPTTRRSSWTTTCDRGRHAGQLQGLGRHQARLRHSVGADHGHARLRQRPAVPADRLADPVHAPARRRPGPGQHRPDQPGQLLLPAQVPVGAPAGSLCLPAARWARPPPLVAAGVAGAGAGRPGRTGVRASRAGRLAAGGLGAGGLVRRRRRTLDQ
ncbi:hypothetical protein G6F65_013590 [Rhizopus arrhizus]|nr:hypothetical protein G6F65_013590 [Rhizopus arrhizus]